MAEEGPPEWKWTETPQFAEDCATLHEDPGEADFIRWVISESILADPYEGSRPFFKDALPEVSGMTSDVRYFRTFDAPGLSHLPPKVVIFQIEHEPDAGEPREVTGLALWDDDDASG